MTSLIGGLAVPLQGILHRPSFEAVLFPQELLNCVVFIGQRSQGGFTWRGTGFFVSVPTELSPDSDHVLLVTAEHSVARRTNLVMRVDHPDGPKVVPLPDGPDWHRHPGLPIGEDESDVAATVMPPLLVLWLYIEANRRFVPERLFAPDEPMSDDPNSGVGLGDEVVALGLLRTHPGTERNATIARTGNIAMLGHDVMTLRRRLPDDTFALIRMRLFLTELRSIHGESGSPVFVRQRQPAGTQTYQIALLGALIGHWTENGENLGIGQVVPSFRIRETVTQDDVMAKLRRLEGAEPEEEPAPEPIGEAEETLGDDLP